MSSSAPSNTADRFTPLDDIALTWCMRHLHLADVPKARLICRRFREIDLFSFLPAVLEGSFDEDGLHWLLVRKFCSAARWPAAVLPALLRSGAPVNRAADGMGLSVIYGKMPLHIAAERGFTCTVKALLSAKAAVDATDHQSWTPLHFAAARGRTETAKALVSAGAAVDAKQWGGGTPLQFAARGGRTKTAAMLRAMGARIG